MDKVVIPATKNTEEIVLKVGKIYYSFTTDLSRENGWLFKINKIENGRFYIETWSGLIKDWKIARSQFTRNAEKLTNYGKHNIIKQAFDMYPGSFRKHYK